MNFLVETKIEYTTQLINILSPYIYEGIQSIYNEAKKIAKKNEELKLFQTFLRKIPKWNQNIIDNETKRILKESTCGDILEELIKAVIKSNIMLLTNTPPEKKNKLKINYVIEIHVFIHNIYIESARNIFQNPFLFYHDYTSFELKKNQRDAISLIKTSIAEAIRKMLPLNLILKEYLGNSFTEADNDREEIDKHVSEKQKNKLIQLLKNENCSDNNYSLSNSKSSAKQKILVGNYTLSSKSIKSVNNKINSIINADENNIINYDETSAALNEPPNPNDIKESYSNLSGMKTEKNKIDSIFKSGNQLSHISMKTDNKEDIIVTFNNDDKNIINVDTEKSITYNGTMGSIKDKNYKLQKI